MTDKPASTLKKRGGKTSTSWKPGQSGNPAGFVKRGSSWVEAIEAVGKMTPADIINTLGGRGDLVAQFKMMPKDIPMKQLVTMRVFGALMFEPTPGLFNAVMDRVEGKPQQPIEVSGKDGGEIKIKATTTVYDHRTLLAPIAPGPVADSTASGQDESYGDGEKVG